MYMSCSSCVLFRFLSCLWWMMCKNVCHFAGINSRGDSNENDEWRGLVKAGEWGRTLAGPQWVGGVLGPIPLDLEALNQSFDTTFNHKRSPQGSSTVNSIYSGGMGSWWVGEGWLWPGLDMEWDDLWLLTWLVMSQCSCGGWLWSYFSNWWSYSGYGTVCSLSWLKFPPVNFLFWVGKKRERELFISSIDS